MFSRVELREERRNKLVSLMNDKQLDALVLTNLEDVRYATDIKPLHSIFFVNNYFTVVLPEGKPTLIADAADANFVRIRMPWVDWAPLPSFAPTASVAEAVAQAIQDVIPAGSARIGYDYLFHHMWLALESKLDGELVAMADDVMALRAIKSSLELEVMERAVQLAEVGMEAVRSNLRPGIAEFELAAEAIYATKKAGAETESHMPALRSGENAAMLQRVESDRRIIPGDPVVADLGARYLGYSAEYCRTFMVGRPSRELKSMYRALFDAYYAGIEMVRPGVVVRDIDREIRKRISDAGYPDYPHATGHGIGMANVDKPAVNSTSQEQLKEGMVICLEPGIYIPGIGGVKEEDLILVTASGHRVMTQTPYDRALNA